MNFDFDDHLSEEEVKTTRKTFIIPPSRLNRRNLSRMLKKTKYTFFLLSLNQKLKPNSYVPFNIDHLKDISAKSLNLLTEKNENFNLKQLSRATLSINSFSNLQLINVIYQL